MLAFALCGRYGDTASDDNRDLSRLRKVSVRLRAKTLDVVVVVEDDEGTKFWCDDTVRA